MGRRGRPFTRGTGGDRTFDLALSGLLPHGRERKSGEYPAAGALEHECAPRRIRGQGERRFEIESRRRPESVEIRHPEHGRALVRDNKPMQEKALGRCLIGMEPTEWYETLNRRVFFWVDRRRLIRLLGARAYRDRPHLVLELDTEQLMRRHWWRVSLSGINSGATFSMNPASRGPGTFRRIADHPQNDPVVELTVDYAVLDTAELVFAVSRWRGAARLETIWERSA